MTTGPNPAHMPGRWPVALGRPKGRCSPQPARPAPGQQAEAGPRNRRGLAAARGEGGGAAGRARLWRRLGREIRVVAAAFQLRLGRNFDEATRRRGDGVLGATGGGRLSGPRGGDDGGAAEAAARSGGRTREDSFR
jgi:hypothetical protein